VAAARRQEDVPQSVASQMPAAAEAASRKLRVLLVDDDSLVSMNTAYMLMDLGHSVLEAPSAAHALQLLETDAQFDIVVTDFAMPGMNGLDLATKIRRMKPKLPVVLGDRICRITPRTLRSTFRAWESRIRKKSWPKRWKRHSPVTGPRRIERSDSGGLHPGAVSSPLRPQTIPAVSPAVSLPSSPSSARLAASQ
jgi:hypothetical protein